jgi:hypothetical protein
MMRQRAKTNRVLYNTCVLHDRLVLLLHQNKCSTSIIPEQVRYCQVKMAFLQFFNVRKGLWLCIS